jgi:hypothetical protein
MGDITAEKLKKVHDAISSIEYKKKDYPLYMWFRGNQYKLEYKGEWEIVEDDN